MCIRDSICETLHCDKNIHNCICFFKPDVYKRQVLALPAVKQFAPTYYDLLALDSVTVEMMANDLELARGVLEDLSVLDLTQIAKNGEYLTMDVKTVINHVIDVVVDSMILEGHTNRLFEHLMDTYVNGHQIAGIDVPNGTIVEMCIRDS